MIEILYGEKGAKISHFSFRCGCLKIDFPPSAFKYLLCHEYFIVFRRFSIAKNTNVRITAVAQSTLGHVLLSRH